MARLLDTPEWNSLTTAQKNLMNSISGNGPLTFRRRDRACIEVLEKLGLVTVDWTRFVASEREPEEEES